MPTVLRVRGYRFFFFSLDGVEPPHIHVEKAERVAKFWLVPPTLARSRGFRSGELREIRAIIEENLGLMLEKWNEFFTSRN
ncbi:MAG: DUF4160 domain-containing protein [Acidobacteria bacterium]|nr:DUF4160 domain-containing protein [Acidobacteriota bacterium]